MPLACRVHWAWVDRTGDTVKQSQRRVTSPTLPVIEACICLLTTRSKMFRQHLKCSLTAPRRAGTSSGFFFLFLFTQPVWAWKTWYSVVWASQSTCKRHDLQRLWYLANCPLLFIFNLSNAESRGTWKGWRTFAWMNWLSSGDTDFFFFMLTRRRRGLEERAGETKFSAGVTTHYDACRRETAWVFPETLSTAQKCEPGRLSDRFRLSWERIAPYRQDQSRVEAYTPGFPRRLFLYPVPSAAARTAPNGVKERASFCLVFRSLNTTLSHRMFSMGYRRAKSTQGNTNFQKRIFLANNSGITTRGP